LQFRNELLQSRSELTHTVLYVRGALWWLLHCGVQNQIGAKRKADCDLSEGLEIRYVLHKQGLRKTHLVSAALAWKFLVKIPVVLNWSRLHAELKPTINTERTSIRRLQKRIGLLIPETYAAQYTRSYNLTRHSTTIPHQNCMHNF